MPKTKKKFIDRKSAVTFHLVHRSQQDPLAADDTAPQHVLLAAPEKRSKDDKVRKEEQKKFGVFYEDDYNYLQHLRDANAPTVEWEKVERIPKATTLPTKLPESGMRLNLPSSVFASEVEEEVGLLNKAAPQSGLRLDLDPDVVAAMDEDFDFSDPENELEDNFIELANADPDSDYEDCDSDDGSDVASDEGSDVASDEGSDGDGGSLDGPQFTFADEETKTRFTNYSMSSSVMRRTEHLSILDSRFEHMYAGYDDAEIGALDCDEIEGHVAADDPALLECAAQFKLDRATQRHQTDRSMLARYLDTLPESGEEGEGDDLEDMEVPDQREKWDCESILSTYSNIYNHPKLIAEPKGPGRIRVSGRTGIPLDVLGGRDGKLTARALARLDETGDGDSDGAGERDGDETVVTALSTLSIRPKDETPAERAERKKALKEYRKERRIERKANSLAFKEEKKRQEKVFLNNNKNQQGIHIL